MRSTVPRVLLIGDYPPPMGGIAVHVQQLHRALRRAGIHSRVLDIGKCGRADPGVINGRGYRNFGRELFRHAREGWILHLHTAGNRTKAWTVAMSVATAGQMFRAPTVLTVHAGLVRKLFATDSSLRRRAQVAMVGYQHVVAVSEDVREGLLDAGIKPSRVSALPAFIASEVRPGEPPPQLNAVRRRRTPLLAVAHHPNPLYGRKLIFDALSRLAPKYPRIGLALFGPETGSSEYLADAERFGVSTLLEDFGELDNPQALAVIREADVFVRPTSSDGDSVSVREALTLGVPCVATDVAVRPPGTIVARAGNAADLAEKLEAAFTERPEPTDQPDCALMLMQLYELLWQRRAPLSADAGEELQPSF